MLTPGLARGHRLREALRLPVTLAETLVAVVGERFGIRSTYRPTHHIWSRGLALLCDHNGGVDYVRKQRGGGRPPIAYDPADYAAVRDGDLVWVRASSLAEFVERTLPSIGASFALITGDEDLALPSGLERASDILASPNVVCWFAQNFDGTDATGKVHPIPIGVDFHTIANGRRWKHWQATPAQQEAELERLRVTMLGNASRLVKAHADFHFNKGRRIDSESRDAVCKRLVDNPNVDFQVRKLPRYDLWRVKTRYAFAICPPGNGLDCHRTWESLLLGNIPIVRRSSLDELYDGLPVAIVDDYSEITSEALRRWHRAYRNLFGAPEVQERLTNRFWIEQARQHFRGAIAARSNVRV